MRGKLEITVYWTIAGEGRYRWEAEFSGNSQKVEREKIRHDVNQDIFAVFPSIEKELSEFLVDDELLVEITTLPSTKIFGGNQAYTKVCYAHMPASEPAMAVILAAYDKFLREYSRQDLEPLAVEQPEVPSPAIH